MPNHSAYPASKKTESLYDSADYKTPELGQTSHRPGAYDAFTKPSLMHGKRVDYWAGRKNDTQVEG